MNISANIKKNRITAAKKPSAAPKLIFFVGRATKYYIELKGGCGIAIPKHGILI